MPFRYERKYIVPPLFFGLMPLIRTHPANFKEVYAPRRVNSLYFDDIAWTSLVDSEEGFFDRQKIRVRWYGENLIGNGPVLEFKTKQGYLGTKDVFPLLGLALDQGLRVFHDQGWMKGLNIPDWVKHRLGFVHPVLLNTYERRYFLSQDKKFRLTIDANICYFPVHSSSCRLDRKAQDPNPMILELKYGLENDQTVHAIVQHFPFRLSRNSKYCTGMNLTKAIEGNTSGVYP